MTTEVTLQPQRYPSPSKVPGPRAGVGIKRASNTPWKRRIRPLAHHSHSQLTDSRKWLYRPSSVRMPNSIYSRRPFLPDRCTEAASCPKSDNCELATYIPRLCMRIASRSTWPRNLGSRQPLGTQHHRSWRMAPPPPGRIARPFRRPCNRAGVSSRSYWHHRRSRFT